MITKLFATFHPKHKEAPEGSEKYGSPAEYIILDDNNYIACLRMYPGILQIFGIEFENEDVLAKLWDMTQEVIRQRQIRVVKYIGQSKPEFIEQLLTFGFIEVPSSYETTRNYIYEYRPGVVE